MTAIRGYPKPPENARSDSGGAVGGPCGGSAPLVKRRIDPLDCRLDLAPVTVAPGAFPNLAHVQQGAK